MAMRDDGASDLTLGDLVGVGILAAPGFVVPPLLGPSVETLGLAVISTAAALGWVVHRAGVLRRSPVARGATSPGSPPPVP